MPSAINPRDQSLRNYPNLEFHALFDQIFHADRRSGSPTTLVELGCARSAWLPYFAKEFGFQVTGIDYSSVGCEQAEAILAREGIDGDVRLADIFEPPADLLNGFNYVISFGLVEHFEATERCLSACAAFLKPGGRMLTVIPNLNGVPGWLQKSLGRDIYDLHVPLDDLALRRAHEAAGLNVLGCGYFLFSNFGVLNLTRARQSFVGLWLARSLVAASMATWVLQKASVTFSPYRLTSPYVICISMRT